MIYFENKAVKTICYMEVEQKDVSGFEIVVIDNTGNVCMYKYNFEVRSYNNFCRAKALSVMYSECVCGLSYPACSEHALYTHVICSLSGCTVFFHIIS
jgi:hypothetical protein